MRRLLTIGFALFIAVTFVAFPADADAYARCNCTAWAWAKRQDLPLTLSHARYWAARASAKGYPVNGTPKIGSVMVLQPGVQGAHRRYGHVAYVIGVSGNRVTVSEMNGGRGCRVRVATYRITRGVSFIHRKGTGYVKAAAPAKAAPAKGKGMAGKVAAQTAAKK